MRCVNAICLTVALLSMVNGDAVNLLRSFDKRGCPGTYNVKLETAKCVENMEQREQDGVDDMCYLYKEFLHCCYIAMGACKKGDLEPGFTDTYAEAERNYREVCHIRGPPLFIEIEDEVEGE